MTRGRRWVFLRGLARERAHWGDFVERFCAAFPGDTAVAADLAGSGEHHAEKAPVTVGGFVDGVRADVIRVHAGTYWLFALSLGGMLAYEWWRRYPEEVAGLVFVNTSVGGASWPWRRLRPAGVLALASAALQRSAVGRERRIFALVSNRPEQETSAVNRWVDAALRHPVRAGNVLRQLVAAARFRAPPADGRLPPTPALVLVSLGDRLVHPSCSRSVAAAVGAEVVEHATAGHDLPLDEPDWVIAAVTRWLQLLQSHGENVAKL